MSKHTPGPWSVFRQDGYATYIHAINEGDEINTFQVASCHCATNRKYFPTRNEAEANARLIAAAPDLLAAMKLVRDRFFPVDQSERDRDSMWEPVNAAIKAAEGNT